MDDLSSSSSSSSSSPTFVQHVFRFDDTSKSEFLNLGQYVLLSVVPIVALNKTMVSYVPVADDRKSSWELSAEIVLQLLLTFGGLVLIHRIVTFVPTYSKIAYPDIHVLYMVLVVLLLLTSLKTNVGEKINILYERGLTLWYGGSSTKSNNNNKINNKKQGIQQQYLAPIAPKQAYPEGTILSSLPTSDVQMPSITSQSMYRNDTTPLVGAAVPTQQQGLGQGLGQGQEGFVGMTGGEQEPMAANAVLGGSFGSTF